MTVHFIGAGPGAPDLITVRGRNLIERCPVCLYAGSLVPPEILDWCPPDARRIDTAPLDLDGITAEFVRAQARGEDVARLHSGDLSIWSTLGEQIRRLDGLGIPYTVTPGVPAFAAAAAALRRELTVPEVAQSVVLTRTSGRASAMPATEGLGRFAATRATLAIHLSVHAIEKVVDELLPAYGADCPAAVVWRASWPDQRIIESPLGEIAALVRAEALERTAVILVGRALDPGGCHDSALYSPDYERRFRRTATLEHRAERGSSGEAALTVEYRDLQLDGTAGQHLSGGAPCMLGNDRGQWQTDRSSHLIDFERGISRARGGHGLGIAAGLGQALSQPIEIDCPGAGMKIEQTLAQLRDLGDAAGHGDAGQGMAAQIFQHAAGEVPHVDQRVLRQSVQCLDRRLGGRAGRPRDMRKPGGARDVDAPIDTVDPGGAGIRHDDPGGAEDRQPADDAEPRVERLARDRLPAGD